MTEWVSGMIEAVFCSVAPLFSLIRVICVIRGCEETGWLERMDDGCLKNISRSVAGSMREFRFSR
jgi:hypothetical protein